MTGPLTRRLLRRGRDELCEGIGKAEGERPRLVGAGETGERLQCAAVYEEYEPVGRRPGAGSGMSSGTAGTAVPAAVSPVVSAVVSISVANDSRWARTSVGASRSSWSDRNIRSNSSGLPSPKSMYARPRAVKRSAGSDLRNRRAPKLSTAATTQRRAKHGRTNHRRTTRGRPGSDIGESVAARAGVIDGPCRSARRGSTAPVRLSVGSLAAACAGRGLHVGRQHHEAGEPVSVRRYRATASPSAGDRFSPVHRHSDPGEIRHRASRS